jgi:hypothetical protein
MLGHAQPLPEGPGTARHTGGQQSSCTRRISCSAGGPGPGRVGCGVGSAVCREPCSAYRRLQHKHALSPRPAQADQCQTESPDLLMRARGLGESVCTPSTKTSRAISSSASRHGSNGLREMPGVLGYPGVGVGALTLEGCQLTKEGGTAVACSRGWRQGWM